RGAQMTAIRKPLVCSLLALLLIHPAGKRDINAQAAPPSSPRVFLLDASHLLATRQRIRDGDKRLDSALTRLRRDAQKALSTATQSVITKDATPPSGDKHDYMSQAPYFWPNP